MEQRLKVDFHQGKKILVIDLSGLKEEEILNILDKSRELMIKERTTLMILDVRNTNTTSAIKEKSAKIIAEVEAKIGKSYTALIGLRLAQQIIANVIKRDQYFASNLEDAMNWLVKKQ